MTKRILTLALALAATGSAFAFGPKRITPRSDKLKVMSAELTAPQKVVTRAAEEEMSVDFTYADVPYSVTGLNGLTKGMEIYQAIGLSGDNLKAFAGDKVTSINITTGAVIQNNTVSDNDLTEVTVFISENLDKDPIYTQKGTLGTAILTENKVTLDTPYEIKENQPFYVGYYFTFANENLGYIVYDGIASDNDDSNIIGIKQGGQIEWMSFPDQIGALCIGCTITGENMPQDSVVLDDVAGPIYAEPGKEFQYAFLIKTAGYITDSVELSYSIGDGETVYQTFDFEKTLPYNKYNIITIDGLVCNQVSLDVPLKFEVTKVNGVENKSSANKKTATIDCFESSKAFPWVHLIEEGTGTWCGWCPLGIVMMEYVTEKYPGLFACVAIHSQDAMTVQSTSGWLSKYASGFPCGYIDRSTKLTSLQYANLAGMQEQMDNFASVYQGVPSTMGFSELNVAIDDASGEMTVDSKVGSAFDIKNNNRYRLSYYITQNDMG
ncbi:MAG: hypothetical protein K2H76_11040, partial [Muribaculaceae bacterium]|nr:hypothetical protein [Muribaculaceae bacterium]